MLMLKGSGWPSSVVSGISTFLLLKYFASILYGCRLPEVRRRVMLHTGPSLPPGVMALMSSTASPIAMADSCLTSGGGAESLSLAF